MKKHKLQQVVDALPEEVDVDAFLEDVYLLDSIETAEKQIEAGEGISHDEAKERLKKWLD